MSNENSDKKKDKKKRKIILNIVFVVVLVVIILVVWYLIANVFVPNAEGAGHIQNFFESIQDKLTGD